MVNIQAQVPLQISVRGSGQADVFALIGRGEAGPTGPEGPTGAPGGSDASFAGWLEDDTSETAAAHAVLTSDALAPVRRTLGASTLFDNFQRSDRLIVGDVAPTGHVWFEQDQNVGLCSIDNQALVFDLQPAQTSIAYADLADRCESITTSFEWTAFGHRGTVVGLCHESFGDGSAQTVLYPTASNDSVFDDDPVNWGFFMPHDATYERVAEGVFDVGFTPALNTRYEMTMRRIGVNTIEIDLPDGTTTDPITDPLIDTYWGKRVGLQLREGSGGLGGVRFTSVTAVSAPEPAQPFPGSYLTLDGTAHNYPCIPLSHQPTSDDIHVRVALVDYASTGAAFKAMSRWGIGRGGKRHYLSFGSSGTTPTLGVQIGGVTYTVAGSAMPVGTIALGVTRAASSGDVKFYSATDLDALDVAFSDPLWTLFRTRTVGGDSAPTGVPDDSTAPLRIGAPIGAEAWMAATVIFGAVYNDTTIDEPLAVFDTRGRFTGIDPCGNLVRLPGANHEWYNPPNEILSVNPNWVRKTADTTRVNMNSTTEVADPDLTMAVAANCEFDVYLPFQYTGTTTGDFKCGFDVPSGATFEWGLDAYVTSYTGSGTTGAAGDRTARDESSQPNVGAVTATRYNGLIRGRLTTSATPGDFTFKWAQASAEMSNLTVHAGSRMRLERIA